MHVQINWLAVVVAAVVTWLLGALWYSPYVLGRQWVAAHGYTPERMAEMRKGAGRAYAASFVMYLVMAAVIAVLVGYIVMGRAVQGAKLGALLWLGFAVPLGVTGNLFSDRRLSTFLIDAGYQLISLVAMGAIIAAWK